jgi:predicted enzyme related to lactoylglutathione lyase
MLKFNSLLLFSEKPDKLAEFYKKVFEKDPEWDEGGYSGFALGEGMLIIGPHDKVHGKNKSPERMLINFETDDVEGEFERIKKLGAKVVAEPYHPGEAEEMMLATFEDLDGNYFQLASPMGETPSSKAN